AYRQHCDSRCMELLTHVARQVAVIQLVIAAKCYGNRCCRSRHGAGRFNAIAPAVGPRVADVDLITTREAVLQACLQGVILSGAERAVEFRGRGSAGLAIQNLACGARPDWRPVRIELVELIRCSRGHVTGRSNPTSEPLFSCEIPGLNVTADEVVVVESEIAGYRQHDGL